MRRKDREVTDKIKIREIMNQCHCCRIGFCDNGQVYIVPLNFGYMCEEDKYILYFHGAREAEEACRYSAKYQSIIGTGKISLVEDLEEKKAGLQAVMQHATGKSDWEFSDSSINAVSVFKLIVSELSCKEHL